MELGLFGSMMLTVTEMRVALASAATMVGWFITAIIWKTLECCVVIHQGQPIRAYQQLLMTLTSLHNHHVSFAVYLPSYRMTMFAVKSLESQRYSRGVGLSFWDSIFSFHLQMS